jgi:very-short-patch-repair endonuclease
LTAAWIHGVDVRRLDDLDIHVAFPKGGRIRKRDGLVVCQETLEASDLTIIDGIQVTTPLRTAFDCARWLRGAERVVVVDALTHAGLVTVDAIRGYIAGKRRLRNLRVAEQVLELVDSRAESPMETRLRVLLIESGLPRPVSQLNVRDTNGRFVARLDLAYEEAKVAVEYDGALHWKQRREDDRRRDRLRELGWVVLVYSADDYYGHRREIAEEVGRHLRRRGAILR